jgi:hypothetical protein
MRSSSNGYAYNNQLEEHARSFGAVATGKGRGRCYRQSKSMACCPWLLKAKGEAVGFSESIAATKPPVPMWLRKTIQTLSRCTAVIRSDCTLCSRCQNDSATAPRRPKPNGANPSSAYLDMSITSTNLRTGIVQVSVISSAWQALFGSSPALPFPLSLGSELH